MPEIQGKTLKKLLTAQKFEISEHHIYNKLAAAIGGKNGKILSQIANDELMHYSILKKYTKQEIKESKFMIWKYYLISRIFGLTFGLKLMEKGEGNAKINYNNLSKSGIELKKITSDEIEHEKELINMIDEERLVYVSSIVLGLNDALVEFTGALAGFTFALQQSKLVAMTGIVTGIAASLSMGASEYMSKKSDETAKKPFKAATYTASAYILTVLFLVMPFMLLNNVFIGLTWSLINAIIVIALFTYYISTAKDYNFRSRFLEMVAISLGVAAVSFGLGYLIRIVFGVNV